MTDYAVCGKRRQSLVCFGVLTGQSDTVAAVALVTSVVAAGQAEVAWYMTIAGTTRENPDGSLVDTNTAHVEPTYPGAPGLNPSLPPAG